MLGTVRTQIFDGLYMKVLDPLMSKVLGLCHFELHVPKWLLHLVLHQQL